MMSQRMTEDEFTDLAARHDGTQGCSDIETEAKRARARETELEAEVATLREVASERLKSGHNDTCAAVISTEIYECSCGHDALHTVVRGAQS